MNEGETTDGTHEAIEKDFMRIQSGPLLVWEVRSRTLAKARFLWTVHLAVELHDKV